MSVRSQSDTGSSTIELKFGTVRHRERKTEVHTIMLLAVLSVVISTLAPCVNGRTFKIGYISTTDGIRGPALTMAIESFQANGGLQGHDIK